MVLAHIDWFVSKYLEQYIVWHENLMVIKFYGLAELLKVDRF